MKKKELKDLNTKTLKELKDLVSKKQLELAKNQVKIASGNNKNIKAAWKIRKEIAQILSAVKMKGLEESK